MKNEEIAKGIKEAIKVTLQDENKDAKIILLKEISAKLDIQNQLLEEIYENTRSQKS